MYPTLRRLRVFTVATCVVVVLIAVPALGQPVQPAAEEVQRLHRHAWSLLLKEEYADAERELSAAIAKVANDGRFYELRGVARGALGNPKAAIADYDAAVRLGRKAPILFSNRGGEHFKLKEYEKALEDYNRALEFKVSPAVEAAFRANRIAVNYQLNRKKDASAEVAVLLALDPDNETAFIYRGQISCDEGNYSAARVDLDRAITLHPSSNLAFFTRGSLSLTEGKFDAALAVKTKSNDGNGRFRRNDIGARRDRGTARHWLQPCPHS